MSVSPIPTKKYHHYTNSSNNDQIKHDKTRKSHIPNSFDGIMGGFQMNTRSSTPEGFRSGSAPGPSNSGDNCASNASNKYPSIEEFLNDTFLYSINELDNLNKVQLIKDFEKYIISLHSQENLKFLIAIYNYEYYYNKVFNSINQLNTPHTLRKASISTLLSSKNSVKTDYNNETSNYFASTIDDLNDDYWETFKMNNLSNDVDDDSSSDDDSINDNISVNSDVNIDDQLLLSKKWNNILTNYIYPDSKYQINLSDNSFKTIVSEHHKFPDPITLLKAKEEILQLLNENAYHQFIKKLKSDEKSKGTMNNSDKCNWLDISPKSSFKNLSNPDNLTSPILTPSVSSTNSSINPTSISKKKKSNFWNHLKLSNSSLSNNSSLSSTPDDEKSKFKLWKKK